MGDQTTDNLHLLVGELTGTVKVLAGQVASQTIAIETQTRTLNSFEAALKHTNEDIRRLREDVVTPEVLRSIGISPDEPEETKADMKYLREQRTAADRREPQMLKLKSAVAIAVITGAIAFGAKMITVHYFGHAMQIETRNGDE